MSYRFPPSSRPPAYSLAAASPEPASPPASYRYRSRSATATPQQQCEGRVPPGCHGVRRAPEISHAQQGGRNELRPDTAPLADPPGSDIPWQNANSPEALPVPQPDAKPRP